MIGLIQMIYFWFKNRSRAAVLKKWAAEQGLDFAVNAKTFTPPENPGKAEDMSRYGARTKRTFGMISRLLGESKIQVHFPQFMANRFRGDWQSEKNICWGTWNGMKVITWDTVYYDIRDSGNSKDWSEGEYSSVLILTDTPLHRTLITPNSLFKRVSSFGIEEGGGLFSTHAMKFELDEFNKAYRVKAKNEKWTYAIIDQAMIEWLLQNKNHSIEIATGGILVSTWFTLTPSQTEEQLKFCASFLEHIPEDLKHHTLDGAAV
jgi:hypothetical protein